jgi:hypothetical protein
MCKLKSTSIKKAAHAGGQAARRNIQSTIRYKQTNGSSRKIPPKPAIRFEQRRQQLIQGLLAASTPAERQLIRKGRAEGRKLLKELERCR